MFSTSKSAAPSADEPSLDLDDLVANMSITPGATIRPVIARKASHNDRAKTEHADIGDNQRTYLEGMVSQGELAKLKKTHVPISQTMNTTTQNTSVKSVTTIGRSTGQITGNQIPGPSNASQPANTEFANIGDNQRTFVEGMVQPGSFNALMNSATEYQTMDPASVAPGASQNGISRFTMKLKTNIKSFTTPSISPSDASQLTIKLKAFRSSAASNSPSAASYRSTGSKYVTFAQQSMAARQTHINSLSGSERQSQEAWAQSQLSQVKSCPEGFKWKREEDGYVCHGGSHYVTDTQLAEGRDGMFLVPEHGDISYLAGPYHPIRDGAEEYEYTGPEKRSPPWLPDRLYKDGICYLAADGSRSGNITFTHDMLVEASDRDVLNAAYLFEMKEGLKPKQVRKILLKRIGKRV